MKATHIVKSGSDSFTVCIALDEDVPSDLKDTVEHIIGREFPCYDKGAIEFGGECLYLSSSLAKVISSDELDAILSTVAQFVVDHGERARDLREIVSSNLGLEIQE